MDKELFETIMGEEQLTEEEMNSALESRTGKTLDGLDEWARDIVEFELHMEKLDIVENVAELGATTSVVMLYLDMALFTDSVGREDYPITKRCKARTDKVGKLFRYLDSDVSLSIDGVGPSESIPGTLEIDIWT